jgi:sialate O-acetylesterase
MKPFRLHTWRLGAAVAAALLLSATQVASAKIELGSLFQDNMVLQQGSKVPIWGKAEPGETVTVSFAGQAKTAVAGADGKWMLQLDPLPAQATPREMAISGSTALTLKNVVVGEVWLASGQSNMEFALGWQLLNGPQEIAAANYPLIREIKVGPTGSLQPLDTVKGAWAVCTPQRAPQFSAAAYFFARELYQGLHVPIGIINSTYGGTPIEAWTSLEAMDAVPAFKQIAEHSIAQLQAQPEDLKNFPTAIAAWEEKYGLTDSQNEGFKAGWAAPETDTADWKKVNAPLNWAGALGIKGGGIFWLRKEVDLPESAAGKPFHLALGQLREEYITAYFNGQEVAEHGRTPPDFYTGSPQATIPGNLVKAGRNVITLRLVSDTPAGGLNVPGRQMQLPVADPATVSDEWLIKTERQFPPLPPGALESRPPLNHAVIQYTATTLFNAMVHPLIPFAIRGVIWYQGEANAGSVADATTYRTLFPTMIADWRSRWQEGEMPFYFVQLANYGAVDRSLRTNPWSILRESQTRTMETTPQTGMAVTIDIGSTVTIHPGDKQDVGKRLATWAFAKTYGRKDVAFLSPIYKSCHVEGDKMRIGFEPGSGALMVGAKNGLEPAHEVPDGKLTWFEIAGDDKKFTWAEAKIDGDSVVVWSPEVTHPAAVRYGWAADPEGCNLYNRAGLPASPFRTDDWP